MLHQRMIDDGHAFHRIASVSQNTVPSLIIIEGRPAVGTLFARDRAAGRPAAAFEHAGERKCVAPTPSLRAPAGGKPVEQRHGQRPPLDDQWRSDLMRASASAGSREREHAGVDEQPAVAIFGEAGEAVDSITSMPAACSGSISE